MLVTGHNSQCNWFVVEQSVFMLLIAWYFLINPFSMIIETTQVLERYNHTPTYVSAAIKAIDY